jgi:hypothetical protein
LLHYYSAEGTGFPGCRRTALMASWLHPEASNCRLAPGGWVGGTNAAGSTLPAHSWSSLWHAFLPCPTTTAVLWLLYPHSLRQRCGVFTGGNSTSCFPPGSTGGQACLLAHGWHSCIESAAYATSVIRGPSSQWNCGCGQCLRLSPAYTGVGPMAEDWQLAVTSTLIICDIPATVPGRDEWGS